MMVPLCLTLTPFHLLPHTGERNLQNPVERSRYRDLRNQEPCDNYLHYRCNVSHFGHAL